MQVNSIYLTIFTLLFTATMSLAQKYSDISILSLKPLTISDAVPDLTMRDVLFYDKSSVSLKEFKGKLILLDWWSYQCTSCIEAMPKLDSLQKAFQDKVIILPIMALKEIDDSAKARLTRFWKHNKYTKNVSLPSIMDTSLYKIFKHRGVPCIYWIDSANIIRAITSTDRVNSKELKSFDPVKAMEWENMIKLDFDYSRSLIDSNFQNNELIKRSDFSVLTKYMPRVMSSSGIDSSESAIRFYSINENIESLFGHAMYLNAHPMTNRIFAECKLPVAMRFFSKQSGLYREEWNRKNLFCYEIRLPKGLSYEERRRRIIEDLNNKLGLQSTMLMRPTLSLVLKNKGKTSLKNNKLTGLSDSSFEYEYFNSADELFQRLRYIVFNVPFVNNLPRSEKFEVKLPVAALEISNLKIDELNKYLNAYGYFFDKEQREFPILAVQ